jgi:hypothetical protein
MTTIADIHTDIINLLNKLEEHDSMEHRMFLRELSDTCLGRWKQIQDMANECDTTPGEERVTGHVYICTVRCENTGETEMSDYSYNTLKEAKDWCIENKPTGSYRNFVRMDIHEIGIDGNPVQWHYKTPNWDGWCTLW